MRKMPIRTSTNGSRVHTVFGEYPTKLPRITKVVKDYSHNMPPIGCSRHRRSAEVSLHYSYTHFEDLVLFVVLDR